MKPQELRIGNFVQTIYGTIFQIDKLSNDSETLKASESIKPIPLTEEWLLKFGFKKKKIDNDYWFELNSNKNWKFQTNDTVFNNFKDEWNIGFLGKGGIDFEFNTNCNYVHQLQNLYFALTGEELNYE